MDFSQQIGAVGSSSGSLYPDPPPASPATAPAAAVASVSHPQPLSPEVTAAPSPSPQSILTDTKNLPANVRYAPSPPLDGARSTHHFDRKA